MFRKLIPFFLIACGAFAQMDDLSSQILVIKQLSPEFTRFGILYNPNQASIDAQIQNASINTGIVAIKSPVKSIREISGAVRSLGKFDVDFIFLYEDKIVTGNNSIKFVVKQTVKKKIPVFTTADNAFKGGAYGQLVQQEGQWRLKINGKVQSLFEITVPDSNQFIIEE